MHRRTFLIAAAGSWLARSAAAQESYPARTIRMVVPSPPGGPNDVIGRALAEALSKQVGQTVIVDPKPGAGGTLGAAEVARARADGYTLLFTTSGPLVQATAAFKNLPYDPRKDFAPIAQVASTASVLATQADSIINSLAELVDAARRAPNTLTYGSWGPGTTPQIVMEALSREAGIKLIHVPYKGAAPLMNDLLARQISFGFPPGASIIAYPGKLKAIAVLGDRRSPFLPSTPTFAEAAFEQPIFRIRTWLGVLVPSGTPSDVQNGLIDAIRAVMRTPTVLNALSAQSFEPLDSSPQQFSEALENELKVIPTLMREAGIEPE